jgi:type IV pilus assembly protein PilM
MFPFVKKWLGSTANPIGVDFGSDSIKMAQVARVDNEWRLVAAASADVPSHVRHDMLARQAFLAQGTRELLSQGGFQGRRTILALPSASMYFQHLRLPKMDEAALKKALPWEAQGKLPIDPTRAVLRHHVAGEVFQDQEAKSEVIVMAAARDLVNNYLATAAKARLDVIGMNVEPKAVVDCFGHIYRRKTDADQTSCFVDMGFAGTRAIVARGTRILFARAIAIGGDHFSRAVASSLGLNLEQARLLRWQLAGAQPTVNENQRRQEVQPDRDASALVPPEAALSGAGRAREGEAEAGGGVTVATPTAAAEAAVPQQELVERAMLDPLKKLVEELDLCRRYYEATFPNKPVDRLIFVGGEARNRWICQQIAQEMGLAAQVGDPLVRMSRFSDFSPDSGIDRRLPQPNWAVAIGLSLGAAPDSQGA